MSYLGDPGHVNVLRMIELLEVRRVREQSDSGKTSVSTRV